MIRIALVDDHAIVREGFRALIDREPQMQVVGEADRADTVVDLLVSCRPDCLVLDLSMPGGGGLAQIAGIRRGWPTLSIVVMSMHDSLPFVSEALERGANAYVTKGVAPDELIAAINTVIEGREYLSSDIATRQKLGARDLMGPLSRRERDVCRLLVSGRTPKQVADDLGIAQKTVYAHRSRSLEKLGVRNELELVAMMAESKNTI